MEHQKSIVILDFGGQYAHLIARRVRQCGVYSEIHDAEAKAGDLKNAAGIILSGGPQSVYDSASPQGDPKLFDLGVPVLGICYGLQWMTKALGGEVSAGKTKEYGRTRIQNSKFKIQNSLFDGCPEEFVVWMSHGDEVSKLPEGFERMGTSASCTNAAIAHEQKHLFGLQFHPEVTHTEHGDLILRDFVDLCDAAPWSIASYAKEVGGQIQEEVGDRKVFMMVSGGVDSTVAFTLLNDVLGHSRVQGLLVDTGLMRKDEVRLIGEAFERLGIMNLRIEDASEEFFTNLAGVCSPEEKRKIIGNTFLDVQKRVAEEMGLGTVESRMSNVEKSGEWMLGQGTIYPDTIETGETKNADQIKTHHNRVEAIQNMQKKGLVIEPLRDLYKDEVRVLGEELGLPHELVRRQPFPGPGLGVRILCAETESNVECRMSNVEAVALPIRSVGVQGDGRTYRHPIALYSKRPCEITQEHWTLATEIPNKDPTFNRVLKCTSHSSPEAFVFTPGGITRERADLLREADSIVDEELRKTEHYEKLWQVPVVLLPFGSREGGQSIVIRPVESLEAMTANAADLPSDILQKMTDRILQIDGIDCVFYDLTHKPPGTIEWE